MQLKEDAWLRRVVPSHESMLQMQQDDLAPPLQTFGENARGYLVWHRKRGGTTGQSAPGLRLPMALLLPLVTYCTAATVACTAWRGGALNTSRAAVVEAASIHCCCTVSPGGTETSGTTMAAPTAAGPATAGEPGAAARRTAIYSQEPLKGLSEMLQPPFLLATNSARRVQFWVLRAISAEVGANHQL